MAIVRKSAKAASLRDQDLQFFVVAAREFQMGPLSRSYLGRGFGCSLTHPPEEQEPNDENHGQQQQQRPDNIEDREIMLEEPKQNSAAEQHSYR